ncbi:MAG: hypothetical protein VB858_17435 [Planctomycetaceae bacterium]
MIYVKFTGQRSAEPVPVEWGNFVRLLEIADDGFAGRQVDVFVNGCVLVYDRELWSDDESMLVNRKYNSEEWSEMWGPHQNISLQQFEVEWEFSEAAPNQPQEYHADVGPWPALALIKSE